MKRSERKRHEQSSGGFDERRVNENLIFASSSSNSHHPLSAISLDVYPYNKLKNSQTQNTDTFRKVSMVLPTLSIEKKKGTRTRKKALKKEKKRKNLRAISRVKPHSTPPFTPLWPIDSSLTEKVCCHTILSLRVQCMSASSSHDIISNSSPDFWVRRQFGDVPLV